MGWQSEDNLRWLGGLAGVMRDHPLARHTSLGVGGRADFLVEVTSTQVLLELVEACSGRGIPYLILGAGTNLLVADAGVEGLVMLCRARSHRIEGELLRADAGLRMMRLARISAQAGLTGLEWAVGVPGTVGGAVYQNAGCWGGDMSQVLERVQGWAPGLGLREWTASELELGYRTSALRSGSLSGAVVLSATLRLSPGDPEAAQARMAAFLLERRRTQPLKQRSCGSVFRNPDRDSAGRLIEAAGMRGEIEGGAAVSSQHANFIINRSGASAADVDRLIRRVQAAVLERIGVELEPEVERVGRWT